MSVFRVQHNKNYTVMSNYHLREKDMSYKAKGLLSFMLSLPPDWDYSLQGLIAVSKEDLRAIKSGLKELEEFGYLEIKKFYPDKNHSKIRYEYNIYEKPILKNQAIQNVSVDNVPIQNSLQRNTKKLSTKKLNTIYIGSEKKLETKETTDAPQKIEKATKKSRTNFVNNDERKKPPTLDEIESFIAEKELSINAKDFYDHYCNNEWIDNQGKLITKSNYRLKVSMWAKNNFQTGNKKQELEKKAPKPFVPPQPIDNPIDPKKAIEMLKAIGIERPKKGNLLAEVLGKRKMS